MRTVRSDDVKFVYEGTKITVSCKGLSAVVSLHDIEDIWKVTPKQDNGLEMGWKYGDLESAISRALKIIGKN